MGNAALIIELLTTALAHASELSNLLQTAAKEGRDVTDAEVAALRTKATASVDALAKQAAVAP
jgi:hypothetical protein